MPRFPPNTDEPMNQYLLSVHSSAEANCEPPPPEAMQEFMQKIDALETEMKSRGAWMFSGRLTEPESATVVRDANGKAVMTDGPFAEAKEHIAGFYVIQAADLDGALSWATKVTQCIGKPIEVRPFAGFQGP